jgi:hypothetical protein
VARKKEVIMGDLPMGVPLEPWERILLRTHTFFRWWF